MLTQRDVRIIAGLLLAAVALHLGVLRIVYGYKAREQAERVVAAWAVSPVARKALRMTGDLDRRLRAVESMQPSINATLSAATVCTDAITEQLSDRTGWRKRTSDTLAAQAKALGVIAQCACPAGID